MKKLTNDELVASRLTYGDLNDNLNEHLLNAKYYLEKAKDIDDYEFKIGLAHLTYYMKMNNIE